MTITHPSPIYLAKAIKFQLLNMIFSMAHYNDIQSNYAKLSFINFNITIRMNKFLQIINYLK